MSIARACALLSIAIAVAASLAACDAAPKGGDGKPSTATTKPRAPKASELPADMVAAVSPELYSATATSPLCNGLAKTRWVLEDYLRKYRFQGVADHLGIAQHLTRRPLGNLDACIHDHDARA